MAFVAGLAGLAGCDAGDPSPQPVEGPNVHITDVRAILASDAATGAPPASDFVYASILPSSPAGHMGDAGRPALPFVTSTTAFKFDVDRLLLPSTVNRQAFCIQPMAGEVDGESECTEGATLDVSYDPVLREVTARQSPLNGTLMPGTFYELNIWVATDGGDGGIPGGLLAFDGAPLGAPFQLDFMVAPDPASGPPPLDPGPTGDPFCLPPYPESLCSGASCPRSVEAILAGCASASCHSGGASVAPEGLDLSSASAILTTAINQTALETETGEAASMAEPNSLEFGRAMPILDPGVPSESYLIYKILASHATPLVHPFPGPLDADGDPSEVTRLRASVVVGLPMPPDNAPAAAALRGAPTNLPSTVAPIGEAEWLSAWLSLGAPTSACP